MENRERRQWIGVAIMAASFVAFFWWGVHFKVFGTDIDLRRRTVEDLGFFGWIVMIMFGFGYGRGGILSGAKLAAAIVGLMALAGLIGYLRGAYH